MASLFHSKKIQAISAWIGVVTPIWTGLAYWNPEVFGAVTLPQALLWGAIAGLPTMLILSASLALYRHNAGPPKSEPTERGGTSIAQFVQHNYAPMTELLGDKAAQVSEPPEPIVAPITGASSLTLKAQGDLKSKTLGGVYVGRIVIAAGHLATENYLEIAITGFNGSGASLTFGRIDGAIRAGKGNIRDLAELPMPAWLSQHTPEIVAPATEFVLILQQRVPPELALTFLEGAETSYVTLDLRRLNITVRNSDDPTVTQRLKLWDAATFQRRDDIVTNRMIIASANIIEDGESLDATGTVG